MKRIFNIGALLFAVAGATMMSSCSDEFIEEKKNYSNTSTEIYDYYSGADGRINEIYRISLPNIQANANQIWQYNSVGRKDNHSQATEEYYGFSTFLDPMADMNTVTGKSQNPGYFGASWARMREINEVIRGITGGSLSQEDKDVLLGQAYFFRAWCYYMMFRYYGSVPIVTEVQNPVPEAVTPRSSAEEVYNFIVTELDNAANMLKKKTVENKWTSDNWGRVTTGTCLALKHRVMVLWASPLFNRDNDDTRWKNAYNTIKSELSTIDACGYGLAYEDNPGVNGKGWANMFLDIVDNKEGVFVSCYNTKTPDLTPDYQRNNTWEQTIRPANTLGNNGQTPTDAIIDLFPMKDGKRPDSYNNYTVLESSSKYAYDKRYPFMNRDPRFYRTFSFPGEYWRFSGDPNTSSSFNPYTGDKYILWNYVWYNDPDKYYDPKASDHYGSDNLLTSVHGMYIRKFSDDLDVRGGAKNYNFNTAGKNVGFRECKTMTMEIRYAEVLLNYAEAACGAGDYTVAVEQLKRIRKRAGVGSADGLYGIDARAASDPAVCMASILYERQIEFAYEGKRFEDMRRWLLFDGGTGFSAIGAKPLTGWGGNTCTWLGFKAYGQESNMVRNDQIEFRLKDELNYTDKESGRLWTGDVTADQATKDKTNPDPLLKANMGGLTRAQRDAFAVDINEKVVTTDLDEQLENLKTFYSQYLVRKTLKGDDYDATTGSQPVYNKWNARYYFLGLTQGEQISNPTLPQTVGWEDYHKGGSNGTYDPLTASSAAGN